MNCTFLPAAQCDSGSI